MKRFLAFFISLCCTVSQAQIAAGSATPTSGGTTFPARIEQNVPGLTQVRNGDASTIRRELGPVMGFTEGSGAPGYVSPIDGVMTTWSGKDSWTYEGQMYLTAGTTYTFGSFVDDHVRIEIDGTVFHSQGENRFGTGACSCTETGWHDVVITVWDKGGGYGNNGSFTPGVAYNTTGQTSQTPRRIFALAPAFARML